MSHRRDDYQFRLFLLAIAFVAVAVGAAILALKQLIYWISSFLA
jgi:hypothetical protein